MIRSTEKNQAKMLLFLQLKHVTEKAHNEIAVINNRQECVSKREREEQKERLEEGNETWETQE